MEEIYLYVFIILVGIGIGYIIGYTTHKKKVEHEINDLLFDLEELMRGEYGCLEKTVKEGEIGKLYAQIHSTYKRTEQYMLKLVQEKEEVKKYVEDISHQLKTPITAISTYLQIIENDSGSDKNIERVHKCIELTDKMDQLIQILLNIARLESNAVSFRKESYYLNDTIEQVFQLIKKSGLRKSILINEVEPDVLMRYDEFWLIEALFNIVKNAIIYGSEKPEVRISCVTSDHIYQIEIKDNGHGIDPEELPFLFHRFYRVEQDKNTHKEISGTGIGLSMSKMIIEKMHGRVEVESTKNGSIFTIYLVDLLTAHKITT